jgi:hypothetical protein
MKTRNTAVLKEEEVGIFLTAKEFKNREYDVVSYFGKDKEIAFTILPVAYYTIKPEDRAIDQEVTFLWPKGAKKGDENATWTLKYRNIKEIVCDEYLVDDKLNDEPIIGNKFLKNN